MNPYKALGLTPDASQEAVKAAYRSLAQKHHPDKGGDPERYMAIQEAYEAISEMSDWVAIKAKEHIRNLFEAILNENGPVPGDISGLIRSKMEEVIGGQHHVITTLRRKRGRISAMMKRLEDPTGCAAEVVEDAYNEIDGRLFESERNLRALERAQKELAGVRDTEASSWPSPSLTFVSTEAL